jgi:hypothetical protein
MISIKQRFFECLVFVAKGVDLLLQRLPFLAISGGFNLVIVRVQFRVHSPIGRNLSFLVKMLNFEVIFGLTVHRLHY